MQARCRLLFTRDGGGQPACAPGCAAPASHISQHVVLTPADLPVLVSNAASCAHASLRRLAQACTHLRMSAHRSFSLVLCLLNDGEPRRVQSNDGCRTCAESAGRAFARVGGGSVQLYSVDATAVIITRHRRFMRSARRMVAGYASRQVSRMCTSSSSSKRREAAAACTSFPRSVLRQCSTRRRARVSSCNSATSQRCRRPCFAASSGHRLRAVAGSGFLQQCCTRVHASSATERAQVSLCNQRDIAVMSPALLWYNTNA
jgi:hypothetical protein